MHPFANCPYVSCGRSVIRLGEPAGVECRVWYNRTLLGPNVEGADARDVIRRMLSTGYEVGDQMDNTFTIWVPTHTNLIEQVLDQLWVLLNADDRPNGHEERSLSVGDVVEIRSPAGVVVGRFAVEAFGWRPVPASAWTEAA